MALPLVHHAFNLSVCSVPVPPASTPPPQSSFTREDVIASLGARAKAPALEIFVAPAGSDVRGDGTRAKPFGTVARAQLKARTAAAARGAVVVWLRAGTHFQEQPLVLTNVDSGQSVHGISSRVRAIIVDLALNPLNNRLHPRYLFQTAIRIDPWLRE